MPFACNRGVRIHYRTEGAGPPLVLQHWSLATMECWYDYGYVSALKDDYRLVLVDARGHGASDHPHKREAYELDKRVGDITAVLDDLGIAQAHFLGYSMGGWIGFGVARFAQDRFRSLTIGGQHPYAQGMGELRRLVQYAVENGPEEFVAWWEQNNGPLPGAERKRMLGYDYEALLVAAQDRESLESVLSTIRVPSLLYAGELDEVHSLARECARQIAGVTFVTLPGLDHGTVIERTDQVLPHVMAFLAKVDAQAGRND